MYSTACCEFSMKSLATFQQMEIGVGLLHDTEQFFRRVQEVFALQVYEMPKIDFAHMPKLSQSHSKNSWHLECPVPMDMIWLYSHLQLIPSSIKNFTSHDDPFNIFYADRFSICWSLLIWQDVSFICPVAPCPIWGNFRSGGESFEQMSFCIRWWRSGSLSARRTW